MEPQFSDNPFNPMDKGDPRTPLEKMRRKHLYQYADAFGIRYEPDCPAEVLRRIISGAGKTGREAPPAAAPVKVRTFEDMTMPELRKLCKEYGFTQSPTDKKTDLVARLNGDG